MTTRRRRTVVAELHSFYGGDYTKLANRPLQEVMTTVTLVCGRILPAPVEQAAST
ncbi:hypothetical protein PAMP_024298 [Pampus punctatissimus]